MSEINKVDFSKILARRIQVKDYQVSIYNAESIISYFTPVFESPAFTDSVKLIDRDSIEFIFFADKVSEESIFTGLKYSRGSYYIDYIFRIRIADFPGNCGVVVLSNFLLHQRFQNKGLAQLILKCSEKLVYDMGFTYVMHTTLFNEDSTEWNKGKHILQKFGYKSLDGFVNARTDNSNLIWGKDIRG